MLECIKAFDVFLKKEIKFLEERLIHRIHKIIGLNSSSVLKFERLLKKVTEEVSLLISMFEGDAHSYEEDCSEKLDNIYALLIEYSFSSDQFLLKTDLFRFIREIRSSINVNLTSLTPCVTFSEVKASAEMPQQAWLLAKKGDSYLVNYEQKIAYSVSLVVHEDKATALFDYDRLSYKVSFPQGLKALIIKKQRLELKAELRPSSFSRQIEFFKPVVTLTEQKIEKKEPCSFPPCYIVISSKDDFDVINLVVKIGARMVLVASVAETKWALIVKEIKPLETEPYVTLLNYTQFLAFKELVEKNSKIMIEEDENPILLEFNHSNIQASSCVALFAC